LSEPDRSPATELDTELDRLRTATYRARDRSGLAEAVVDGDGTVVRVAFTRTVTRLDPVVVGEAVRAAVSAARVRAAEVAADLVDRAVSDDAS